MNKAEPMKESSIGLLGVVIGVIILFLNYFLYEYRAWLGLGLIVALFIFFVVYGYYKADKEERDKYSKGKREN